MIWKSMLAMTLIDIVIGMIALASLTMCYRQRHMLSRSGMLAETMGVVAGLGAIGLFYVADLFVMWVLPPFITMPRAMAVMTSLHLNYLWVVVLAASVSIFIGIGFLLPKLFAKSEELRKEIATRAQAMATLQETEARYRELFESSSDALMTAAPPSWRYTGANQAALDLFGVASVAAFTELGSWDVSPELQPDGRASDIKAQEAIDTAMRDGKHHFDWKHRRMDGSTFSAAVQLTRMNTDGELFVQANVRDITERQQAEEKLAALAAELEIKVASRTEELTKTLAVLAAADRTKSEFMANVTHELRTPLNAVIGFTELLKDEVPGPLNAKQAAFADDILAGGRHLLALVEAILEMSRLDAGGAAPKRETVEIGAALEERVAAHRAAVAARGLALRLDGVAEAGSALLAPGALRRMLDALIDNAIKFNREGGTVTVRARRSVDAQGLGGALEIAVADTGIGIAREDLGKLFKPLTQLDAGLARRHGGVGLGLALARGLAELHGGTIEVESEPGKGSTFTLRLPIGR